mmetsp:Transcript_68271/g.121218  ORF Transcript_68271/g.121218 Transcript_68271/m.121218 type:complete len:245 (+) Transcript_68271:726-1460(+)
MSFQMCRSGWRDSSVLTQNLVRFMLASQPLEEMAPTWAGSTTLARSPAALRKVRANLRLLSLAGHRRYPRIFIPSIKSLALQRRQSTQAMASGLASAAGPSGGALSHPPWPRKLAGWKLRTVSHQLTQPVVTQSSRPHRHQSALQTDPRRTAGASSRLATQLGCVLSDWMQNWKVRVLQRTNLAQVGGMFLFQYLPVVQAAVLKVHTLNLQETALLAAVRATHHLHIVVGEGPPMVLLKWPVSK